MGYAAALLDQPDRRGHGAAGGEDVVDEQHPLPRLDRVLVQLEGGLAVLEGVRHGVGLPRQLARLPDRDEPASELQRDRRRQDEPARLHSDDLVDDHGARCRRGRRAASASMTTANPSWSASSGLMSLNTTPGSGKSGTSTTSRSSASRAASRRSLTSCLASIGTAGSAGCVRTPCSGFTGPWAGGATRPRPAAGALPAGRLGAGAGAALGSSATGSGLLPTGLPVPRAGTAAYGSASAR